MEAYQRVTFTVAMKNGTSALRRGRGRIDHSHRFDGRQVDEAQQFLPS